MDDGRLEPDARVGNKISPGCRICYAARWAERFRGVPGHAYERGFDPRLVPGDLVKPLHWRVPQVIFVNSMSDLFHDAFPDDYVVDVIRVMCAANWHVYQVLTKRPERMRDLLLGRLSFAAEQTHIWWGTSVEDNELTAPRIDHLPRGASGERASFLHRALARRTPAAESGSDPLGDRRVAEAVREPAQFGNTG